MIDDFSAAKPLSSPPNGACAPRFRAVQTSLPSTMRCALARRVRKSGVVVKEHEFARFAKVFLFFSFLCRREAFVCVVALKKSKIFSFFFFFFCFFCDDDETIFLKKYFFLLRVFSFVFLKKGNKKRQKIRLGRIWSSIT